MSKILLAISLIIILQHQGIAQEDQYPPFYTEGVTAAQEFKYEEAIDFLEKAIKKESRSKHPRLQWLNSMNAWISHCYLENGHYKQAIAVSKQVLETQREIGAATDEASLLAVIAESYHSWGNYKMALAYHDLSIEKLSALKKTDFHAIALNNIAETLIEIRQPREAIHYGLQAKKMFEEQGMDVELAVCLTTLAKAELQLRQLDKAMKYANQALSLCQDIDGPHPQAEVFMILAEIYHTKNKVEEANKFYAFASEYHLMNSAPMHPHSVRMLVIGAHIAIKGRQPKTAYQFLDLINKNYKGQWQHSFPAMSEEGRLLFHRVLGRYHDKFNSFVMETHRILPQGIDAMFENQVMHKSMMLEASQKLKHEILTTKDTTLVQLYEDWVAVRELIAKSYSLTPDQLLARNLNIPELKRQKDGLEEKLNIRSRSLRKSLEHKIVGWKDVQKKLKADEVAIEMIRFNNYNFYNGSRFEDRVSYAAIIITKDQKQHPDIVFLNNGNELEDAAHNFYMNAIKYKVKDTTSYHSYWKPIENKLPKTTKTIYFSPDGIYGQINLGSLFNNGSHLIDQYQLRLVSSSRDLLAERTLEPKSSKVAVLFGFPNYKMDKNEIGVVLKNNDIDLEPTELYAYADLRSVTENVEQLPGTKKEVESIELLLKKKKWKPEVFLANNALEEHVKSVQSPSILHIATHGFFKETESNDDPLLASGLLLSGATGLATDPSETLEDGVLTALEASELNLDQTQLVVLSACETAKGKIEYGEGVYGLQRSFMIAGAQRVVMSLWKVDDQATQLLMTTFYAELMIDNNYREALRRAQIKVRQTYPEPFYWGGFIMIEAQK